MRRALLFVTFAALLVGLGCGRSPGGVAPSNIPLDQGKYRELGPVSASDCKVNLLGSIPVSGGNQLSDALDEAQSDRDGADALVDITIERVAQYWILWSSDCTIVRATAVSVN